MKNKKASLASTNPQLARLTKNAEVIASDLLRWFAEHGRHSLPWQHPRTPYAVWLSEIMLQQTQVATVIPYFEKFVSRFPDVQTLAAAEQDDVLSYWSGLGYYARARNLHKSAVIIVNQHGGKFPDQFDQLLELPGIGRSTANAILAQAFAKPAPILDGNVRRILARLTSLDRPPQDAVDTLWEYAEIITPAHSAADFTQAIMDLGALLCTRSKPKCDNCPLRSYCNAFEQNATAQYPVKKASKPKPTKQQDFYLYLASNKANSKSRVDSEESTEVMLQKRPEAGIWGGLWCLPTDSDAVLDQRGNAQELPIIQHTFTHYHLELKPILCRVVLADVVASEQSKSAGVMEETQTDGDSRKWFSLEQALKKGLPAPIRVLLENIQAEQKRDG